MYGDVAVIVFTIAAAVLGFILGRGTAPIEYVYIGDEDDGTGGAKCPDYPPPDLIPPGLLVR